MTEEPLELDIADDRYCGDLNEEIVSDFICMLCYGVVWNPIKCKKCETLVCRNCVNEKKLKQGKFMCFKKCGSKRFVDKMSLSEKLILNNMLFSCQNYECEEKIPYG